MIHLRKILRLLGLQLKVSFTPKQEIEPRVVPKKTYRDSRRMCSYSHHYYTLGLTPTFFSLEKSQMPFYISISTGKNCFPTDPELSENVPFFKVNNSKIAVNDTKESSPKYFY